MNKINVLNDIFTQSNIKHIGTLIENIKNMNNFSNEYSYEIEIRIIDDFRKISCSKQTFTSLPLNEFYKVHYSDNIIKSYKSNSPKIHIRSDMNNNYIEKKINISTISSIDKKQTEINRTPIIVKFNIETNIDIDQYNKEDLVIIDDNNVFNYQRKQRISYKTNTPLLRNWRIDKTIRFFTNNPNDKKLYFPLTEKNVEDPVYYDMLDIEFEYIGPYNMFEDSLYKLFEYIYIEDFTKFNIMYNNINEILMRKYSTNLSVISSNVGIITNDFVKNNNIEEYIYEEKFDGERVMIIVYKQYVKNEEYIYMYEYTKKYFKLIYFKVNDIKESDNDNIISIIDAEKIKEKDLYIVFDCLLLENEFINNKLYTERLKKCNTFVEIYKDIINCYRPKCYGIKIDKSDYVNNYKKKWNSLLKIVNTRFYSSDEKLKDVKIDGLILHKNNTSFINGELYKLKNNILMTIDFMLKWIEEKQIYYLYLIGMPQDVSKRYPMINSYSKKHFGYSLLNRTEGSYILFDNPFIPNLYTFEPTLSWYNSDNKNNMFITDDMKNSINEFMKNMIDRPNEFNNKIIELSLYQKYDNVYQWLPLKIREDKTYPNGYRIGVSNIESIFDSLSSKYFDNFEKNTTTIKSSFYIKLFEKYITIDNSQHNIIWSFDNENYSFPESILKLYNIENINLISENKLILTNVYDLLNEENKKLYKPNKTNFIDISCITYNTNDYNFIISIYNNLLKQSFVNKSITLYIENNIETLTKDGIDSYINYLNNIMSPNCKYILISRKKVDIKQFDDIFNTVIKNIKMSNKYISIYEVK